MEKILMMNLLYDFYGELLTEKQKNFFELYYNDDLSLFEIAEQFDISPQAVRDLLKRTERLLQNYEAKLLLVKKYLDQKEKLKEIHSYLKEENIDGNKFDIDKLEKMINGLIEL